VTYFYSNLKLQHELSADSLLIQFLLPTASGVLQITLVLLHCGGSMMEAI